MFCVLSFDVQISKSETKTSTAVNLALGRPEIGSHRISALDVVVRLRTTATSRQLPCQLLRELTRGSPMSDKQAVPQAIARGAPAVNRESNRIVECDTKKKLSERQAPKNTANVSSTCPKVSPLASVTC